MPVDGCRIFLSADFVLIQYKLHIDEALVWPGRSQPLILEHDEFRDDRVAASLR